TAAALAMAQIASGGLIGSVCDQAGAPVPGATITVTAAATNARRVVQSTRDGDFTAAMLPPGEDPGAFELAGFTPARRDGVRVLTGVTVRLDFELSIGGVQEQVTVTGDAPMLRATTASLGAIVEHDRLVGLPLNGRAFITLAALAPGVAL